MRASLGIAAFVLVALAGRVAAAPTKIVVLPTEGRADAAVRARIDASLIRIAASGDVVVTPGDIAFADAATGVGCSPDAQDCRDQVLEMLGVDEIVYGVVTPKPGGMVLVVHRVTRGTTRSAQMSIASGAAPDDLGGIAPLFGSTLAVATEPVRPVPGPDVDPAQTSGGTTTGTTTLPAVSTATDPAAGTMTAPIGGTTPVDVGPSRNQTRLQIAGMAGGGAFVLIGFLLWGEAGTVQEEVDTHPTATREQLQALERLEAKGDSYAAWGNVLFLGGAILGGVSTYYYLKGRKARQAQTTARVMPTVFGDHGAGLVLTIGGSR